jgi:hypothetical protein
LISRASIVLPTYSGVRPIISPPTKVATVANSSMPSNPEPEPPMIAPSSIMFASSTSPLSGR